MIHDYKKSISASKNKHSPVGNVNKLFYVFIDFISGCLASIVVIQIIGLFVSIGNALTIGIIALGLFSGLYTIIKNVSKFE